MFFISLSFRFVILFIELDDVDRIIKLLVERSIELFYRLECIFKFIITLT